MRRVVAFDFDGTLTSGDTLLAFIRYACGTRAFLLGFLRYAPLLVLMKLHLYPNYRAKQEVFAHFFAGMPLAVFDALCQRFAADNGQLLRPQGLEALRQAQREGAEVLIVSASIDNWVRYFFDGVTVLGTEAEVEEGRLTGRFLTRNCYGQEKVNRIRQHYPDRESYHLTAYGDSRGDREMLAFADESHYQPFREKAVSIVTALKIFLIKPEERLQALLFVVVATVLNALFILRLHPLFQQPGFGPYWKVFEREFHLGGYDPYTYMTVTEWDVIYEVHRHPLLAFMAWPFAMLNKGLTWLFGVNCVQYVLSAVLVACSLYSYIFIYRILREVIQLPRYDATMLSVYFFSMAYIMLSTIVPDHFTVSMFLLLLTLYISGVCIQKRREFLWWQSAILFFVTAGVTLSNGVKIFLSGLFVNVRDFFRRKYLLLAVVLPALLLWGVAMWEQQVFMVPKEKARMEEKQRHDREQAQKLLSMTPEQRQQYERRQARREIRLRRQAAKSGTPMEQSGYLKWTDISTSRWQSVYENLFGESVQFHQRHFLEDTLVGRPVFVGYDWTVSYFIEALVVLLFAVGIWCGRRSRFLWLCLCCLAFDMFLHLVLGFGLNEVFIMAPHFLFVLPIATGFLLKALQQRRGLLMVLRPLLTCLAACLLTYNGYLLISFLLTPIRVTL